MIYKIDVSFDSETADVVASGEYFQVLKKYDALGIGHRNHTSTMFITSREKLNLEELSKDLGDISVLSVKKFA